MTVAFESLIEANRTRHVRFYASGQKPWTQIEWVLALGGEVGEALNVVKKLIRDSQGMAGNSADRETLLARLGEELADVVIYAAVVAGLNKYELPWRDFWALRRTSRLQRDRELATSAAALGCELLWWVGQMAVSDGTREILTFRQIEGLILAVEDLADTLGIDLGAAVVAKFNATSEKLGFPERL